MALQVNPVNETDPLVVAVVSVALTLVVGLVTALLTRKGEHAKWLREQRYEAYVAFMIDMSSTTALIGMKPTLANLAKVKARADAIQERMPAAFEAVSILGPRAANAAGQEWVWAVMQYAETRAESDRIAVAKARWKFLLVIGGVLRSNNVTAAPATRPSVSPDTVVTA